MFDTGRDTTMRTRLRALLALVAVAAVIAAFVLSFLNYRKWYVITALAAVPLATSALNEIHLWWLKGRRAAAEQVTTAVQAAAAADWLAHATAARWHQEARDRKIENPAPAAVRWRWAPADLTVSPTEAAAPPPPGTGPAPLPIGAEQSQILSTGVVTRLHDEVYARLPYGRLVLTGGPGSGKTGAMIQLLLAALAWRAAQPDGARSRIPVPVWLTLGGWNPETEPLAHWVAAVLTRDYPALRAATYGTDAAGTLVRSAHVALFLDGLDELPAVLRAAALRRLNAEAGELRVVLTTRPAEYEQALRDVNLHNCAVIELRPIRVKEAAAYLLRGQAGPSRERWEQVTGYLTANPDSVAARALDNPLTLSMARDAYASGDPAVLTDSGRFPTVDVLTGDLIDQFLVTAYPDERQRAYTLGWLAWIARNLGATQDLRWWDICHWVPGWQLRLARGVLAALAVGPVVTLLAWLTYRTLTLAPGSAPGIAAWAAPGLATGLGAALLAGLVVRLEGGPRRRPRRGIRARLAGRRGGCLWLAAAVVVSGLVSTAVGAVAGSGSGAANATGVATFALIMVAWVVERRSGGRSAAAVVPLPEMPAPLPGVPSPLLEMPVVRAVTGAVAVAAAAALWAGLVAGPRAMAQAAYASAVSALLIGGVLMWLWGGARSGRLSGPWALAPRLPRPFWLVPFWLIAFPLMSPRWVGGWVTPAADAPSATAASTYRADRRTCAIYASAYAIVIAICLLVVYSVVWATSRAAAAGASGPSVGAEALLAGWGAAIVLVPWCIAWLCAGQVPLVNLTQLVLRARRGRVSFARLLDDAQRRQVLRQAGTVYQFRHAAIQARLAGFPGVASDIPDAGPVVSSPSPGPAEAEAIPDIP